MLAAAAFAVIHYLPAPAPLMTPAGPVSLSAAGKDCLGLLTAAVILWVFEALDFSMTALIMLALMPVLGISDGLPILRDGEIATAAGLRDGFYEIVRVSFGHRLLLFFVGVFILSGAISRSGLARRLVLLILKLTGGAPGRIVLGAMVAGCLMAMWITAVAAAAVMAVIAAQILEGRRAEPGKSNFGRALMIACCWGPLIGGVGTPAGAAPNPIAIAYLRDMAGYTLTFTQWMSFGVPICLVLIPAGWLILCMVFPMRGERRETDGLDPDRELSAMGRLSPRELATLVVFALMAGLWMSAAAIERATAGAVLLPMEWVALMGGLALCFPGVGVLSWEEAMKAIPWNAVLLMMASIGLGQMMFETGAARWLSWIMLGEVGSLGPLTRIAAVVAAMLVVKVFLASNAVTGTVMIPLFISLALDLGLGVWALTAPAAFSASLGLIMITESPTNVIPYQYGYFTMRDFMKSGLLMSIVIIAALTAVIAAVGAVTGLYQF